MKSSGFDYINVIPLVDVMLVLLTIVLTTSTFIAAGAIPVELPKASASPEIEESLTIDMDSGGRIFLRSRQVTLAELGSLLVQVERSLPVLIRADRSVALQQFVDVLESVKLLGFKKVSLQTEQKT